MEKKKSKMREEWKVKCDRFASNVKVTLKEIIFYTTKFQDEFSELKHFSHYSAANVHELRYIIPIVKLVDRLVPEDICRQLSLSIISAAKSKMLQLLEKHQYLRGECAKMDVETSQVAKMDLETRREKAVFDFVDWWKVYLAEQKQVLEMVFDLKWLLGYLNSIEEEELVQIFMQGNLLDVVKVLGENSQLSKQLFGELEDTIMYLLQMELNVQTPKLTFDAFVFHFTDYIDNHKILDRLDEYVDKCIYHFDETREKMIAPYFALCQSSGYGKSRIVNELGKRRPVMYVSMKKEHSKGYPPRSTRLIDKCFRIGDESNVNRTGMLQAIKLCYEFFINHPKQGSPMHVDSERVYSNEAMKKRFEDLNYLGDRQKIVPKEVVILVIDEARKLLDKKDNDTDIFCELRKFLRESWPKNPVFAILVGTQSRFSNFSPSMKRNAPTQCMQNKHNMFFHPFILTDTYNAMKKFSITEEMTRKFNNRNKNGLSSIKIKDSDELWNEIVESDKLQKDWKTVDALRTMGRPLWKWASLEVGQEKLYGNRTWNSKPTFEACLAILFCRVGGTISSVSTMSTDLVEDSMATLLDCSNTHHFQLIRYVLDPYLAYCAKSFWQREDFVKLHLLPAACIAFVTRVVEKGYPGHFEAHVIILSILDRLSLKDQHCWVDVGDFLNVFNGNDDTLNIQKGAKVSVFQFVPYADVMVPSDLIWLVQRRAAAILNKNHRGADILIPYWYENNGNSADVRFSYILVKVQNMEEKWYKNDAFEKLQPKNVFKLKSSEHDEDEYESLQSTCYTNGAAGIVMSLQSECVDKKDECDSSYEIPMLAASGLDNYKEYLQENEGPLMDLLQDNPGVKMWQQLDKEHARKYEHRDDVKVLPNASDPADSEFGPIANAMVHTELETNIRKHSTAG